MVYTPGWFDMEKLQSNFQCKKEMNKSGKLKAWEMLREMCVSLDEHLHMYATAQVLQ